MSDSNVGGNTGSNNPLVPKIPLDSSFTGTAPDQDHHPEPEQPSAQPTGGGDISPSRAIAFPSLSGPATPQPNVRHGLATYAIPGATLSRPAMSNDLRNHDNVQRSMFEVHTLTIQDSLVVHNDRATNPVVGGLSSIPSRNLDILEMHSTFNAIHTSAVVESKGMCLPGTRTVTLERLRALLKSSDPSVPDVIWMYGPAGAGKSAVVRSAAHSVDGDPELRVLGSFFFFRADKTLSNPKYFIPTLTFQLCSAFPEIRPFVAEALHLNRAVFTQSIHRQSTSLLVNPITSAYASGRPRWLPETPLVIIIDGLDECQGSDSRVKIVKTMVELAFTIRKNTQTPIKVLITSRSDYGIQKECRHYSANKKVLIVELDHTDSSILHYFDSHLGVFREQNYLVESWPSQEQLLWLIAKASGQYAFPHCVILFLTGGDPVERLRILQNVPPVPPEGLKPYKELDDLYFTVLAEIPLEIRRPTLLLLATLLHPNWKPDDVPLIHLFLGVSRDLPGRASRYLSPVIRFTFIEDQNPPLVSATPYHTTLGDFLQDRSRSEEYDLFVPPQQVYDAILKSTLELPSKLAAATLDELARLAHSRFFDNSEGLFATATASARGLSSEELRFSSFYEAFSDLNLPALCLTYQLGHHLERNSRLGFLVSERAFHEVMSRRMSAYRVADDSIIPGLILLYTLYFTPSQERQLSFAQRTEHSSLLNITQFIDQLFRDRPFFRAADASNGWNISHYFLDPILRAFEASNEAVLLGTTLVPAHPRRTVEQQRSKLCNTYPELLDLWIGYLLSSDGPKAQVFQTIFQVLQTDSVDPAVEAFRNHVHQTHTQSQGMDELECEGCNRRLDDLRIDLIELYLSLAEALTNDSHHSATRVQGQLYEALEGTSFFQQVRPSSSGSGSEGFLHIANHFPSYMRWRREPEYFRSLSVLAVARNYLISLISTGGEEESSSARS